MHDIDRDRITEAVIRSFDKGGDPRLKQVIAALVTHLHAFAREVDLTPEEWRRAIDFLHRAAEISTNDRSEFVLTSDVLGLSSLVDLLRDRSGATERSVLGPFYAEGAPMVPVDGDLIGKNPGTPLLMRGHVLDSAGKPVAGALLEFWQAADNGKYWQQDAAQAKYNLYCRMQTGADGRYAFTTIKPSPYKVPYDGPVGDLLRVGGRHAWRPAHFHFKVSAPAHQTLVTELFFAGDPYLDADAVFGVRAKLVLQPRPGDAADAARYRLQKPHERVEFDFRLPAL
ncbi:MAG: dioxygenase [Burkholderiales bacterium]